jgi:FkbM family methyltransferase
MGSNAHVALRSIRLIQERGVYSFLRVGKLYAFGWFTAFVWAVKYGIDPRRGLRAAMSTEVPIFRDLFANLRPNDVFYDVGAHTGLFTEPVASMLGGDRVVAFEPGDGATRLKRRLADAGLEATVVEKAISHQDGDGYYSHSGRVGLLGDTDAPAFTTTNAVEILDDDALPTPTVVKIDVFGAEGDVLKGLEEILSEDACRLVYLEVHLPMTFQRKRPEHIFENFLEEWSLTEVVEVLFRCGFDVDPIYLRSETDDLFIKAEKPT